MTKTGASHLVIAIDGPAGAGKSTVAKAVAAALGLAHLDTGAMYRAVTARALASGVAPDDAPALRAIARDLELGFTPEGLTVDGEPVGPEIRTPAVDAAVSAVSAQPEVREALVRTQRAIMASTPIVAEGRDIGTVVYPEAPVKVYLTASIVERARRRAGDLGAAGHGLSQEAIEAEIERRDRLDSTRTSSPLRRADDAVEVDTTGLTIDEVVERIAALAEKERA